MTKPHSEEQGRHTHGHHSSPFDEILVRVDASRETKPAPGLARAMVCRCANPQHEDKHPSLLVSETQEGIVLMHCRAGCSNSEVLRGLGLEPIELIPEHLRHSRTDGNRSPHKGPRFSATQALQSLAMDVIIVSLAAAQIRRDGWLDDADLEALIDAEKRIRNMIQAGGFLA
ncbi:hypothetical protein LV476_01985 [Guyparkeria hydrothermalis]|uniref:hypothetical protein n=1 Tax=Guyparkeria hydrothermalis TaxID=923 RepID=UPI002020BEB0|nr:hypothetical protein [Guyparkeria hydrothermalis]MCL7743722.1 hypothetical protein [Guyparkeria hydrothermalis]